jgi:hypothetical protein
VDDTGRAIALWGFDTHKYPVFAIGDSPGPDVATEKNAAPKAVDLSDPRNQRVVVGIQGNSPFLDFRTADGSTRMRLNLSIYGHPLVWMADETDQRVWLGAPHSDTPSPHDSLWGLYFEPNRARIGMDTETDHGEKYVRGFLFINKDNVPIPRTGGR